MMKPMMMTKRASTRLAQRRDEQGAAVVEGALVFGIFMTIVLGLIEFGLFFMFWSSGRNATSEAAHEAALAGKASAADFSALYSIRSQLKTLGGRAEYVIVYRAKSIKDTVPPECLTAAETGKSLTNPDTPVGDFTDNAGGKNVETFTWESKSKRPQLACNVYYPRMMAALSAPATSKDKYTYNVDQAVAGNPSLDRFWPGQRRRDSITGPVDYVGIYIRTQYTSATGIIPSRKVNHNSIIQIEPRSTN
jgi:Flp pilus assembly protein TadG